MAVRAWVWSWQTPSPRARASDAVVPVWVTPGRNAIRSLTDIDS